MATPPVAAVVACHRRLQSAFRLAVPQFGAQGPQRARTTSALDEMRVVALTPDAFAGRGGIAQYNRDFLTALCHHPTCCEVCVVPRNGEVANTGLPEGLRYVEPAAAGKLGYLATACLTALRLRDVQLVVCGHINLLPVAVLIARLFRAPVLTELYGIDAWEPTGRATVNCLARRIRAGVAISAATRQRFLRWSGVEPARVALLPNAIHADRYGPGAKSEDLLTAHDLRGRRVLMTLGRLQRSERYKGVDEVLELLPTLAEEKPEVVYLVVGDGDDRGRLTAKAWNLGIGNRVRFAGYVPDERKADYYRLADVYVMPSSGEGFGFVFLEAMACGVPVIASTADGGREAVRDGSLGTVVDPKNRTELKNAIVAALARTDRVVPAGLEYFSFERFTARLHAVVDSIQEMSSRVS